MIHRWRDEITGERHSLDTDNSLNLTPERVAEREVLHLATKVEELRALLRECEPFVKAATKLTSREPTACLLSDVHRAIAGGSDE